MLRYIHIITFLMIFSLISCDDDNEPVAPGQLDISFLHLIDGNDIDYNVMQYINAAGNEYEVTEIQWFISDITLVSEAREEILLDKDRIAHYIDTNMPDTWQYQIPDEITPGDYQAIKITFGIKGEKNIPYSFPNPPESNMLWPINLGGDNGGYHYMKLNGFWMNTEDERTPFNFHIGVGPVYDNEGNVLRFEQNWFETTLPNSSFTLLEGQNKKVYIEMNVENWFQNPHEYDHNAYGGKIMNNQEAMNKISENGMDVFTVSFGNDSNGATSK